MTDTIDDARTSAGLIEDTYETGSDGVQRRRPYAVFMRWTRRVHMYAGLFMLPWVLMYGTSALFFNHADLCRTTRCATCASTI